MTFVSLKELLVRQPTHAARDIDLQTYYDIYDDLAAKLSNVHNTIDTPLWHAVFDVYYVREDE